MSNIFRYDFCMTLQIKITFHASIMVKIFLHRRQHTCEPAQELGLELTKVLAAHAASRTDGQAKQAGAVHSGRHTRTVVRLHTTNDHISTTAENDDTENNDGGLAEKS